MKQFSIDSQIDDLPISPEAFRVYFFLSRYTQQNNRWPSDALIGFKCFPDLIYGAAMRKLNEAIRELENWNLIYINYQDPSTESWRVVTDSSEWKRPGGAV